MEKIKKIEIELDESGKFLKHFKVNDKKYGIGITDVNIKMDSNLENIKIFVYGNKEHIQNAEKLNKQYKNIFEIKNTYYKGERIMKENNEINLDVKVNNDELEKMADSMERIGDSMPNIVIRNNQNVYLSINNFNDNNCYCEESEEEK